MITWHWVRHGPTHQKTFVGWRDVAADLSDTVQITRLNAYLPTGAHVIASDLIRASATADALETGRTRLPDHPGLREFHFGDWDGKHFSQIADTHPDLSRAYWETPGDIRPPGGESWNEAARRVREVVDRLNAQATARHVIAVAHIGVILTQIQRALGCAAQDALGHEIDNLSVTRITCSKGKWNVEAINHLP